MEPHEFKEGYVHLYTVTNGCLEPAEYDVYCNCDTDGIDPNPDVTTAWECMTSLILTIERRNRCKYCSWKPRNPLIRQKSVSLYAQGPTNLPTDPNSSVYLLVCRERTVGFDEFNTSNEWSRVTEIHMESTRDDADFMSDHTKILNEHAHLINQFPIKHPNPPDWKSQHKCAGYIGRFLKMYSIVTDKSFKPRLNSGDADSNPHVSR